MDERAFVSNVESANADELTRVFAEPAQDEEAALRKHLGDERFEKMRDLALASEMQTEGSSAHKGNVIVTHGIMGSALSVVGKRGDLEPVWLNPLRLILRGIDPLRLADDGRTPYRPGDDVRATGLMLRYYGDQVLSLKRRWNVSPFWFDWRRDLNESADELRAHADRTFGPNAPFHIVAHSMGGLVARTFMKRHPQRWESMWDGHNEGKAGGRLVMLGTPNHGSYAIPLLLTGLGKAIRLLAAASPRHSIDGLLAIVGSFVGTYQMLPSPYVAPEARPLYDSKTYARLSVPRRVPQRRLDNALEHHDLLLDAVDAERMVYVAGYGYETVNGVRDAAELGSLRGGYTTTETAGDGTVPHALGFLETPDGKKVTMYLVRESHGDLARNGEVNAALDNLLESGTTGVLSEEMPAGTASTTGEETGYEADTAPPPARTTGTPAEEQRVRDLAKDIESRKSRPGTQTFLDPEERELTEILMGGL